MGGGGILLSGKKARGGFAGLALHEDSLRYLELERNGAGLRVTRQEFVPVPAGGVVKESLQKVGMMERAFEDLKSQVGRFTYPIILGGPFKRCDPAFGRISKDAAGGYSRCFVP